MLKPIPLPCIYVLTSLPLSCTHLLREFLTIAQTCPLSFRTRELLFPPTSPAYSPSDIQPYVRPIANPNHRQAAFGPLQHTPVSLHPSSPQTSNKLRLWRPCHTSSLPSAKVRSISPFSASTTGLAHHHPAPAPPLAIHISRLSQNPLFSSLCHPKRRS